MGNIQLPDNIEEIKKFAKKIIIDVKYLLGEKYEGHLYLYSVRSLPDNIVFNVGGFLWLDSVRSLPENIKFKVGGNLYLSSVQTLPDNIIFNVGGNLFLPSIKCLSSNFVFNVSRRVYFSYKHKVKVNWS